MEIRIEIATPADAAALLDIYAHYVRNTAITFEYEVPSLEEFAQRIGKTLAEYPYLVAKRGEEILGYAYAGAFHPRAAYHWAAELAIYVKNGCQKMGIGKRLYAALEEILKKQGILNLEACIAYPEAEDEYLTKNSVEYHRHLGYRLVGQFHQCGYKFGKWYHMVWMEKIIGEHLEEQPPVRPFPEIKDSLSLN
ncbi:N-acetyltransferase family protein [Christensenellaceae bacterium 44-20]